MTVEQISPTAFRIPVRSSRYRETDTWTSDAVLKVGRNRFKFGFVGPDGTAVRVDYGPALPGPYAYGFALGVAIDNRGGSGAESRRRLGYEKDAQIGDTVEIRGYRFVIGAAPNDNIALTLVDPDPATDAPGSED
jgi:hypothetical protein